MPDVDRTELRPRAEAGMFLAGNRWKNLPFCRFFWRFGRKLVRYALVAVDTRRPGFHRCHHHLSGRRLLVRIHRLDGMAIAALPRLLRQYATVERGRNVTEPALSQYLPAIQSSMRVDPIVFFGLWGFKVPATALHPFSTISWANSLASASALNLQVARTTLRSPFLCVGATFER